MRIDPAYPVRIDFDMVDEPIAFDAILGNPAYSLASYLRDGPGGGNAQFIVDCVDRDAATALLERTHTPEGLAENGGVDTYIVKPRKAAKPKPQPLDLIEEYGAWCKANSLPPISADELICEDVTPAQKEWLADFIKRWEGLRT